MTYEDIVEMLEECGIPFAYDHFAEGEAPDTPYMAFLIPDEGNFAADDKSYVRTAQLNIELYTDAKDPELEGSVEAVFENYELIFRKNETFIESENLYEVLYSTEVLYVKSEQD